MVAIAPGTRVYLDANIVIYFVEDFPEYRARIADLFRAIVDTDAVLVSSELTLAEVLVQPLRNRQDDIVQEYETFLTGGDIELIPVSRAVLRRAAVLRAELRMKMPDAIHVASAAANGCSLFVSNDDGIRLPTGIASLKL